MQSLTNQTTATTYGSAMLNQYGRLTHRYYESVPVYSQRPNGPFLFTHHLDLPMTYLPTVSYCGGLCIDCQPETYILTRDKFLAQCCSGVRFTPEIGLEGPTGSGTFQDVKYDCGRVQKALIIIRNPFHVIQDRFVHNSLINGPVAEQDWIPRNTLNEKGFQVYCEAGTKFEALEKSWYDSKAFEKSVGVPCHAEVYRWVQWLNLVFQSIQLQGIPYDVVHYDELRDDMETTMNRIMNFYELETVNEDAPEFYYKGDRGFFRNEDKVKIKELIRVLAQPDTLGHIERYIQDEKSDDAVIM